jgi:glycosyltransferase involved in cell wall biosynthesis/ubiquinone/menaquinone biosynthesis C-methylase UbiE
MTKKDILLIGIIPPPINGQTIAFQALANEMNVSILTLSGKRNENIGNRLIKAIIYFRLLFRLITKLIFKNHVVYHTLSQSKSGFMRDFPIVLMAKFLGSKIIVHIHGGNYDGFYEVQTPFFQKQIRKMLNLTNSIIVLSENMKRMFDFEPKLRTKIKVIPNGLPWHVEEKKPKNKVLPTDKNTAIKILFLSNLIESKGYLDVLESIEILVNKLGQNVKADFCGEFIHYDDALKFKNTSDAKGYFFDFISENRISQNIEYQGIIENKIKQKLLKEAHFFILPTQYINEGQPISIIEAMAYHCVVLTTNYRGISEMIKDNESGIFVEFNNPNSIVQQIHHLIQNPSEYNRISNNSYQNFQANFTKERHLKTLIHEIESHLEKKNVIDFHSDTAVEFDEKYHESAPFQERYAIWTTLLNKYIKPGMKVLDAGCGSGIFSIYLARKKCIVVGIDGSKTMIELCNENQILSNSTITFIQDCLPFENLNNYAKQDLIICSSVLEYIIDIERVIRQFTELLNPNGLVIISMPNKDSWYRKMEKYIFKVTGKPAYYQFIQNIVSEEEFSKRLNQYGFELQEVIYYPNTTLFSRLLKVIGISEKNTNTMFVGVYKLH